MTITHLAIIHMMILLTIGFLVSTDIWGHGISQAITVSPSSSWLAKVKFKSPNSISLLLNRGLFFTLMAFRDVFFVGLMLLSSGYMIILLSRHRQHS
ncbi:hypothetical protein GH733_003140 [Mirounga leonina]|nr:hypothetical protein GH733_003140 [Mirounga leonina]